jgi:Uma2 family endonuclease
MTGMALSTFTKKGLPFTYSDLEDLPEDENCYELSFGSLVVTPAPNTRHQALAAALAAFLYSRKLPSQRVLIEAELLIQPDMVKRPDVQVVNEALVGGQSIVGVPDLVIEIHSPATRVLDLTEKRFVYAAANIPAYWVIDPDAMTLTILELRANAYEEIAVVNAQGSHDVTIPFATTIDGSLIFE